MLAVLLAEDDAFFRSASHRLRLHRFSVIRYRDPVKLSDDLGELRPDILVVRCEDFPLHGELLAAQLQYSRNLSECPICLFVTRQASAGFAADRWSRLTIIEEDISGSDTASRAFSSYLATLSGARPESGLPGLQPGSRLVAAARRERRS